MHWIGSISNLREFLLDFLWAQWTSLGLPGNVHARKAWVIDPEAVIAAGLDLGRYDPRLFDGIASWMRLYGRLVDAKRLRALLSQSQPDVRAAAAALADILAKDGRSLKWASIAAVEVGGQAVPFFRKPNGQEEGVFGTHDPVFFNRGLRRPAVEWRLDTGPLPASGWPGLRLRMRALFGIGVRADVLTVLLAVHRSHPRMIGALVDAAPRSVSEVAAEMKDAGVLETRKEGRKILYSIRKSDALAALADVKDIPPPAWVDWPRLLSGLCSLVRLPEDERFRKANEAMQRSRVLDIWESAGAVLCTGVLDGAAPATTAGLGLPVFDRFVGELQKQL